MNSKAFTTALLIAILASFMVYTYIEDREKAIRNTYGKLTPVVVAKNDIKEFEVIDESKLNIKNVPQDYLQPQAFQRIEDLENTMATVPIIKGEQITRPRVTYPGAKTGLSRQVGVGMRAMAIRVDGGSAVSGLIKPGDRVDIIMLVDFGSGRKDLQDVRTVLEDVLVLSTGMSMTNNIPIVALKTNDTIRKLNLSAHTKFDTMTLELNPYDAQKLVYLVSVMGGVPNVVLRNNNDKKRLRPRPVNLYDVLGNEGADKAKKYFQERFQRARN